MGSMIVFISADLVVKVVDMANHQSNMHHLFIIVQYC